MKTYFFAIIFMTCTFAAGAVCAARRPAGTPVVAGKPPAAKHPSIAVTPIVRKKIFKGSSLIYDFSFLGYHALQLARQASKFRSKETQASARYVQTAIPSGFARLEQVRWALAVQKTRETELISILGRLDTPTDGVHDYCGYLAQAFARRGTHLQIIPLRWEVDGWAAALSAVWKQSRSWRNRIVLLQYTALMWSRRGLPFGALAVLAILKFRRVRLCVVFHDAGYEPAKGLLRRFRVAFQNFVIRNIFRCAEFPVLTVPPSQIGWLPQNSARAAFIPVGANFSAVAPVNRGAGPSRTIAVFGVTEGAHTGTEARQIAQAVSRASEEISGLRLVVFGRGALAAEPFLRSGLAGANVGISVSGVLSPDEVRERLIHADVLLFVRGAISSRRGSAIAGIVCGLPVVGYCGAETAPPVTEAGVLLVKVDDRDGIAQALRIVLTDEKLSADLRARSIAAAEKYFSWDAIASQFVALFFN